MTLVSCTILAIITTPIDSFSTVDPYHAAAQTMVAESITSAHASYYNGNNWSGGADAPTGTLPLLNGVDTLELLGPLEKMNLGWGVASLGEPALNQTPIGMGGPMGIRRGPRGGGGKPSSNPTASGFNALGQTLGRMPGLSQLMYLPVTLGSGRVVPGSNAVPEPQSIALWTLMVSMVAWRITRRVATPAGSEGARSR